MKNYTVVAGDNLSKIAKTHGLSSWQELYYHPANAAFRQRRTDPNRILPGDRIVVPDQDPRSPDHGRRSRARQGRAESTNRGHDVGTQQTTAITKPEKIKSFTFWINAFIPAHVEGYTLTVPAGPYKGKTMIPGPFYYSDCFLTDQRSFSNALWASSRMHSEVRVSVESAQPKITDQWHNCDITHECDCEDGAEECKEKGSTSRMHFIEISSRVTKPGYLELEYEGSANNPCSPSSRIGGDIDMEGRVIFNLPARLVAFVGKVDAFPAFEAYAAVNDGEGKPLFRVSPPPGNTVMDLPFSANRRVSGIVEF